MNRTGNGLVNGFTKRLGKGNRKMEVEGVVQLRSKGGGFIVRVRRRDNEGKLMDRKGILGSYVTIGKYRLRREAEEAYRVYKDRMGLLEGVVIPTGFYDSKMYRPVHSKAGSCRRQYSNKIVFIVQGTKYKGYYYIWNNTYVREFMHDGDNKEYNPEDVTCWRYASNHNTKEVFKIIP